MQRMELRHLLKALSWIGMGLVVLYMVLAVAGCGPDREPEKLDCPAEDSCEVDYRDGGWYVRTTSDYTDTGTPGPWVRVTR